MRHDDTEGDNDIIEVHTSCGRVFRTPVREMSDRQLKGLLEQNDDGSDPPDDQIAAMRAEAKRRSRILGI